VRLIGSVGASGELAGIGLEVESVLRSKTLAVERPYIRPDVLLAMFASNRAGHEFEFDLWRAFAVERWLRLFIDPQDYAVPARPTSAVRASDHATRLEDEPSPTSTPG
jgi:hypothetical protein